MRICVFVQVQNAHISTWGTRRVYRKASRGKFQHLCERENKTKRRGGMRVGIYQGEVLKRVKIFQLPRELDTMGK